MLMIVDINVMACDLAAKPLKTILSSLLKSRVELCAIVKNTFFWK
jgi:hypothetical protein